jgi:hypothetical protein
MNKVLSRPMSALEQSLPMKDPIDSTHDQGEEVASDLSTQKKNQSSKQPGGWFSWGKKTVREEERNKSVTVTICNNSVINSKTLSNVTGPIDFGSYTELAVAVSSAKVDQVADRVTIVDDTSDELVSSHTENQLVDLKLNDVECAKNRPTGALLPAAFFRRGKSDYTEKKPEVSCADGWFSRRSRNKDVHKEGEKKQSNESSSLKNNDATESKIGPAKIDAVVDLTSTEQLLDISHDTCSNESKDELAVEDLKLQTSNIEKTTLSVNSDEIVYSNDIVDREDQAKEGSLVAQKSCKASECCEDTCVLHTDVSASKPGGHNNVAEVDVSSAIGEEEVVVASALNPTGDASEHNSATVSKHCMSFADGLDADIIDDDESSSWSEDTSDDDSTDTVSVADSGNDDTKSESSGENDSESIISDEVSKRSEGDESHDINIDDDDIVEAQQEGHFLENEKFEVENVSTDTLHKTPHESIENMPVDKTNVHLPCITEESTRTPETNEPIRTRRGVQRKATGDSDTLGELLRGISKTLPESVPPQIDLRRSGRRKPTNPTGGCGTEEMIVDAPEKKTLRTRRGVQRHPTGDADTLGALLNGIAISIPDSALAHTETTQRRGRRKPTNNALEENVDNGNSESLKGKKEPLMTRRGVQRQATGDADTLGVLVLKLQSELASAETIPIQTEKTRRGGRKKERLPSEDLINASKGGETTASTDTSNDEKYDFTAGNKSKPIKTRNGLIRRATGDSETLVDLIAYKNGAPPVVAATCGDTQRGGRRANRRAEPDESDELEEINDQELPALEPMESIDSSKSAE